MEVLVIALGVFLSASTFAPANVVGKVTTKGIFFKDTLEVQAFDDPTIKGVTCYTTVHSRALSFSDSSSTSLSCRKTGKIEGSLVDLPDVFSRSKSFFFKKTVVDRFYDKSRKVLVYLTYTKASGGKNNSNSISVVVVN